MSHGSSLKSFNFKGWTADQILEKYESVLASREDQITGLSCEVGSLNSRLDTLTEEVEKLREENASLKSKLEKKEKILQQELNSKEIMFMRLEKIEGEYDELKKQSLLHSQGANTNPNLLQNHPDNKPLPPLQSKPIDVKAPPKEEPKTEKEDKKIEDGKQNRTSIMVYFFLILF